MKRINIINHNLISKKDFGKAKKLCQRIDIDDTAFVALAISMKANIWTGDKTLINSLIKQGFNKTLSTNDLLMDFAQREISSKR